MLEITSHSNSKVKYIKSLAQKKTRQKYGEYTIEGIKSVIDAINSKKIVTSIFLSEHFFETEKFEYPADIPLYKVSDYIFEKMCDTTSPQGILAIVGMNDTSAINLKDGGAYIYCDCINDPGNLGTIIRTADAAGFDGILLSDGCVDLYSPKVVRSSMGSFFNVNLFTSVNYDMLAEYGKAGFSLYAGALGENTIDYLSADMTGGTIIVVGNEANGVCDVVQNMCQCVKIPIIGSAESLNVGVAASILMYELVRQRT